MIDRMVCVFDALEELRDDLERICESRQTSAQQAWEIAREETDDPSDDGAQALEDQRVSNYFASEARGLFSDLQITEWAIATLRAVALGYAPPAMPTPAERVEP